MAFQAVPNVAQVRVEGLIDNQLTINDFFFEISGGGINAVNLASLAGDVFAQWNTNITPLLSDDWTQTRTVAIDLTAVDGPVAVNGSTGIGGTSGEANPNNVAICISFRTSQRGRSFRGRNFVPGIPGSAVTLNTIDAGYLSSLVAAYQSFVGAGTVSAGWQWGVVSRKTGGVLRPTGIITPIVTAIAVTNKVRSMRSREVGHGR